MRRLVRLAPSLVAYLILLAVGVAGYQRFEPLAVNGGSMGPSLTPGDLVLVGRGARVGVGDIALLRATGHGPVLHRVTAVSKTGAVRTRGDANPIADRLDTPASQVAGRVVLVVPIGALLARWRDGPDSATLSAQSDSAKR